MKNTSFYLTPNRNYAKTKKWYTENPIGENTLANITGNLLSAVKGYYTNHSLRRTCIKRLNTSQEDMGCIQKRTGHQSLDGVAAYNQLNFEDNALQQKILYMESRQI